MTTIDGNAIAFLSYAHADDDADDGRIRRLAQLLQKEYQFLTGQPLTVFIDRHDIKWGQEWKERVDSALQTTTFFIPVLSNSFFDSEECRREFFEFYNTANALGVSQYLLAIRYGPVSDLRAESSNKMKAIAASTQYKDWTRLRLLDETSSEHRLAVNDLASELKTLMEFVASQPAVPPAATSSVPADEATFPEAAKDSGLAARTPATEASLASDRDDPYGEGPSLMEDVAEFIPRAAALTEILHEYPALMNEFTDPMDRATERINGADASGKGFAHRLLILRETATEMEAPSKAIEDFGNRYINALLDMDRPFRALAEIARAEMSPTAEDAVALTEAQTSVHEMAEAGADTAAKVQGAIVVGRELARMSRDLRPAMKRFEVGNRNIVDGQTLIQEWADELAAVSFEIDQHTPGSEEHL